MAAGPVDTAADTFEALVFQPLVDALIAALAFPPFSGLISLAVNFIAGKLFSQLKLLVNFEVILLNNEAAQAAFAAAQVDLKQIARGKGVESAEFQAARKTHQQTLAKLIRYTGA